jgi:hypothetical protein
VAALSIGGVSHGTGLPQLCRFRTRAMRRMSQMMRRASPVYVMAARAGISCPESLSAQKEAVAQRSVARASPRQRLGIEGRIMGA